MRLVARLVAAGLGLMGAVGVSAPAWAGTLQVAAASSSQEVLQELAARFERASGHQVRFSFGASGKLCTQIAQGAPFALFFSADESYATRLHGLVPSDPPRRYATGRLALWAPIGSSLDLKAGLAGLRDARIGKVAIANPNAAPYGRAALEALKAVKAYDAVAGKLVLGANAAQAAQFVESGAADVGLLPLSLALSPKLAPRGKYAPIPARLHQPIEAYAVVLSRSPDARLARDFLGYCLSPSARPIWRRYGFDGER